MSETSRVEKLPIISAAVSVLVIFTSAPGWLVASKSSTTY